jgi:hypothetical protein
MASPDGRRLGVKRPGLSPGAASLGGGGAPLGQIPYWKPRWGTITVGVQSPRSVSPLGEGLGVF